MKHLIQQLAHRAGYHIMRRDLVPFPEMKRNTLARFLYFANLMQKIASVPGDIVECGVYQGTSLMQWLILVECESLRWSRRVWGFDSFCGFPVKPVFKDHAPGNERYLEGGKFADTTRDGVLEMLRRAKCPVWNLILIGGDFKQTLQQSVLPSRIALLHLDCDLYDSYQVALDRLYASVSIGGIIAFDDYSSNVYPGAKLAVEERFGSDRLEHDKHTGLTYIVKR